MTTLKQGVPQIVQLDLSKENFMAGMFWFPALITNFLKLLFIYHFCELNNKNIVC